MVRIVFVVKEVAFAVPGDLATPTGGYLYDARLIAELRTRGWTVENVDLGAGFPRPSDDQRRTVEGLLSSMASGRPIVIDGLAFGALPELAPTLAARHPLVALVHHPLALETGLGAREQDAFRDSEKRALAHAHRIVVTSHTTARILVADYGVEVERVAVARPGVDAVRAVRRADAVAAHILSVGAVTPRKGYDLLIAALAQLTELPWRLRIVGDLTRDTAAAGRLQSDIRRFGLDARVEVLGAVSRPRLLELFADADLFALASRFEGYGMAYAEAIAHGLPVVGTTAGAIPETVPGPAALLVAPDDIDALAEALRRVVGDASARAAMALAARTAAASLPRWRETAAIVGRTIEGAC